MPTTVPHTFHELWKRAVDRHGDRPFLVVATETDAVTTYSYTQFEERVERVAVRLQQLGVGAGDAVHLAVKNSPAFVAIWLAVARLGAWMVPVDPASAPRDIASQVRRTKPRVGICASSRSDAYRDGLSDADVALIEVSETARDLEPGSPLIGTGAVHPQRVAASDRLAVMFTSGTTSEPKGVVLTQRNYVELARTMADAAKLRMDDRWLVTLPLFHGNAQFYCFAPAMAVGASVALTATFSASRWCAQAAELGATCASLFAAPIRMILARRPADAPRLALRHVWFAQSLGADHYREFAGYVGCEPRQLYGMTETAAIVTADLRAKPGHDVIGSVLPGRRLELRDPATGVPVAEGEPGVMTLFGRPGIDVFEGYLDDPQTTANAFTSDGDGVWFRTGDLARRDADGLYRFVGRIDDVIKVSGENVSLTEVEAALAQAPGVLELAVLAEPDPIRDHVPVAYFVPRDPSDPPSAEQLADWAQDHLAPQARPRRWTLIDELPRTSVGKVRRFRLAETVREAG